MGYTGQRGHVVVGNTGQIGHVVVGNNWHAGEVVKFYNKSSLYIAVKADVIARVPF